ncbi:MAG TPA: hypothetical protein VLK28_07870 [Methylomirabilota bacterium]|nr:hypothetical protein [Methylomirabilota bacterium]
MGELASDLVRLGLLLMLWGAAVWVGGASVTAWVAWERGREPAAWFVLALFLSPLVGLVAVSAVPTRRPARRSASPTPRPPLEDPVVVAARLVNGLKEDKRWDVATSAATTTRRSW